MVGYADETVQEFLTAVAARSPQRVFLVVGRTGRPVGVVSLAGLARLTPGVRTTTQLGRVTAPLRSPVDGGHRLAEVAPTISPGGRPVAMLDAGVLVGTLDVADISRAADLVTLGLPVDRRDSEPASEPVGHGRHVDSLMS